MFYSMPYSSILDRMCMSACMKTHRTNACRTTRLIVVGANAALNIRPTQAARANICCNFIVGKEATVHKRSVVARSLADLVPRTHLVANVDRMCDGHVTRYLQKSRNEKGWLMSGRETSKDQIHLQFPIEFHRRFSQKCWWMCEYTLCIFLLL